jgi:hypothetical protein
MTEKIGYKLNLNKLKGAPQSILPYFVGAFYYTEDFEYFNIIKPYLDIPEPPKSLEEISQELDEKFEKLIEKTHLEYRIGHNWLYKKKRYEEFCKKQDEDFEYARENGFFPPKLTGTLDYSNLIATGSNITSSFVIKSGGKEVGYYTFGNRKYFKYFMDEKPNFVVRFCMDKLLGFKWIDV